MKLAIIGQPGVGKTTFAHILEFQYPNQIVLVPDKLDLLNKDLIPEAKNISGHKSYQKALFYFQRELEELVCSNAEKKLVVCDGSALDVLNSWPDSIESFFDEVRSTLKKELDRYDWVLQISSINEENETHDNQLLDQKNFWIQHPRYLSITKDKEFNLCAKKISNILSQIIRKVPHKEIMASINKDFCMYQPKIENQIHP